MSIESINQAETLANNILRELEDVSTRKLRELKPQLSELRNHFKTLKPKQKISDCRTWDEFCSKRLHRTKRAVNLLLAERPEAKEEQTGREETSHSDAELPFEIPEEDWTNDPDLVKMARQLDSEPFIPPAPRLKRWQGNGPGIPFAEDLDRTKKKARHLFHVFDSCEDIARKLNQILEGLLPCRKFKVTVEEVQVPPKPKTYHYEAHPGTPTGVARVCNAPVEEPDPKIIEILDRASKERAERGGVDEEVNF